MENLRQETKGRLVLIKLGLEFIEQDIDSKLASDVIRAHKRAQEILDYMENNQVCEQPSC